MRKKTIFIILVLFATKIFATTVYVTVSNLENKTGFIRLVACEEEHFTSETPEKFCISAQIIKLTGSLKEHVFVFNNMPEGEFAFFGYLDAKNKGTISKNLFGIPTDTVFYSADVTPFSLKGAPKFEKVKTKVEGGVLNVKLITQ
ncbi:MAG: DUF2141 domain-containing protein [Fusobacteriaceae bacterium]